MSKKRAIGPNGYPSIRHGNPRRPSDAMNGAIDAQPLGRTISNVTKQKFSQSYHRPSDSLDSISDDEDRREKKIIRSHVKPNKNLNSFAEIRAPRIPKEPRDPSKPPVLKHRDLPSIPIVSSHHKIGSSNIKPKNALSRSLSTDSNGVSSSEYAPLNKSHHKFGSSNIKPKNALSRSLSTDSNGVSSSEYTPLNKIPRLSTKIEIKEKAMEKIVKNEDIEKPSKIRSTVPVQEIKKEREVEVKKEVEVEMPKPRFVPSAPKREIKEEIEERGMKKETSDEEEEKERSHTRLKMKKARPAEELEWQRKMANLKKEIKEEEIITID